MKTSFGIVKSIYKASNAGDQMQSLAEVQAIKGQGLAGDRYAMNTGFWQTLTKPRITVREVSFISASDIEGTAFSEAETRRNIVVLTDYKLVELIDQCFYVGDVLFKGIEDCTPCKRPSELSGKENFAIAFKNKGGLRAQVLNSGLIKVMDSLFLAEDISKK